jgi:hypothetical protein
MSTTAVNLNTLITGTHAPETAGVDVGNTNTFLAFSSNVPNEGDII